MPHAPTSMVKFLQRVKEQVVSLLIGFDPKGVWELLKELDVVLVEIDGCFGNVVPDRHLVEGSDEGMFLDEVVLEKVIE